MALTYTNYIDLLANEDLPPTRVTSLALREGYNSGWSGNAMLVPAGGSDLSAMLVGALVFGLAPSSPMSVLLTLPDTTLPADPGSPDSGSPDTGDDDSSGDSSNQIGTVLRSWPSVISKIEPTLLNSGGALLNVVFADPVTYLLERPVWGAYRGVSAAEMIGGAISLAAGGDGRPTLNPVLPNMPTIKIIDRLRDDLAFLPYSIACGEPLGWWLDKIQGMLGIRVEMVANADDRNAIDMVLTDQLPTGTPLSMSVLYTSIDDISSPDDSQHGSIYVAEVEGRGSPGSLGSVLDDLTQGTFRRFGAPGGVSSVINTSETSLEEAVRRNQLNSKAAEISANTLTINSKQPALRPGRLISFDILINGTTKMQVVSVYHMNHGGNYINKTVLAGGNSSWHPAAAELENVRYVTGAVDGGDDFAHLQPVPRDELGRVPVTLSFIPSPLEEEQRLLRVADTNQDSRITLADFEPNEAYTGEMEYWEAKLAAYNNGEYDDPYPDLDDDELTDEQLAERVEAREQREAAQRYADYKEVQEQIGQYTTQPEVWEAKLAAYNNGEYDDPYPDMNNSELTEEQLAERVEARKQREAALRYAAYKKAREADQADADRDGYITDRDALVSPELEALLREPGAHERFQQQLALLKSGEEGERDIPDELLEEYDRIFGMPEEGTEDPYNLQKRQAAVAAERWPPRIPMAAIEPMAGGGHGFIPGHRHGDICRIAVHNPLLAEIVGYQYRGDRQINPAVLGSSAGLIVEHDFGYSWSGLTFRRLTEQEINPPTAGQEGE